jgi:hypothetical protein
VVVTSLESITDLPARIYLKLCLRYQEISSNLNLQMSTTELSTTQAEIFRISPLIRFSLYGLFIALTLPLPFLMVHQHQLHVLPVSLTGFVIGWLALTGLMSQCVQLDDTGIRVGYARWVPSFLVQGWALSWTDVNSIHSRPTSQGGQAHYLRDTDGTAYLLPMRISGFARFLRSLEARSQLDTQTIKPLAQPWMYLMLAVCVVLLLGFDIPIIVMALSTS